MITQATSFASNTASGQTQIDVHRTERASQRKPEQRAIVGQSRPLREVVRKAEMVAPTDSSVLLLGETGTGKELFARAIHACSNRANCPLIKVNCAALPGELIESELFGHLKGAFTDAICSKKGRFELADGGTLFLDEIGELDPAMQAKLLRVLQEGELERIGSAETVKVDVRIIAATNCDLSSAISRGQFREDLYYRLAVFPIKIPSLRMRRDDIPALVRHFIAKKQARIGKRFPTVSEDVMRTLRAHDWPGNIRELENVIERAMIVSPEGRLSVEGFRAVRRTDAQQDTPPATLDEASRVHIVHVLKQCRGKVKGRGNAADRLGLHPSTLRYRMKKLGIN